MTLKIIQTVLLSENTEYKFRLYFRFTWNMYYNMGTQKKDVKTIIQKFYNTMFLLPVMTTEGNRCIPGQND